MLDKIKANLVEDWNHAHTWLSVQLASLLVFLDLAYDYLPALKDYLPEGWVKYIALAIIVCRVIKQKEKVSK